jgi:hypothetical protein
MEALLEDFYITVEETRNKLLSYEKISSVEVSECRSSLDQLYVTLQRLYDDLPMDSEHVYVAMVENCKSKATQLAVAVVNRLLVTDSKHGIVDDGIQVQQGIARIMEICIRFMIESCKDQQLDGKDNQTLVELCKLYSKYQRQLLRHRSKPSIANLAAIRKEASAHSTAVISFIEYQIEMQQQQNTEDQDNGHGHGDSQAISAEDKPHASAITSILGEGSSLIHPLLLWKEGAANALQHLEQQELNERGNSSINAIEKDVQIALQSLCHDTIKELDREAKKLAKSVGEWFLSDIQEISEVSDELLEEIAFVCQVLNRYIQFSSPFEKDDDKGTESLDHHLIELTLLYTAKESKWITKSIDSARTLAQPVQLIMGVPRFVPSVVEDTYYISQRSLERANETLSPKATSMLSNYVVEIWSVNGAVHDSLMQQEGCCVVPEGNVEDITPTTPKSSFGVLLNKLERDKDGKKKAPSSGENVDVHQIQMDTQLCLLNGIQAASLACISLSNLFDTLLPEHDTPIQMDEGEQQNSLKATSKESTRIQLAKEEIHTYAKSYQNLLRDQISQFLQEWIGIVQNTHQKPPLIASLPHSPCLHRMFHYFSNQDYNLNSVTLQEAESDDRMNQMLAPIKQSRLMNELEQGKCDDEVTLHLIAIYSRHIAVMILSTLVNQKKFSEWGSLLLSKQVRTLEGYFCNIILGNDRSSNTSLILQEFQKLTQAITILQCGKPSDWAAFEGEVGDSAFDLSKDEVRKVMNMRLDWSSEVIDLQLKYNTIKG